MHANGTVKSHIFNFEDNLDFEDKKVILQVLTNKISLPTAMLFI
jgi:hypothetical protein